MADGAESDARRDGHSRDFASVEGGNGDMLERYPFVGRGFVVCNKGCGCDSATCSFPDVDHEMEIDVFGQAGSTCETHAIRADLEVTEDSLIVRPHTKQTVIVEKTERLARHPNSLWVLCSPGMHVAFGFFDLHITQKLMEAEGERITDGCTWDEAAQLLSTGQADRYLVPVEDEIHGDEHSAAVKAGLVADELPSAPSTGMVGSGIGGALGAGEHGHVAASAGMVGSGIGGALGAGEHGHLAASTGMAGSGMGAALDASEYGYAARGCGFEPHTHLYTCTLAVARLVVCSCLL